MEPIKLWENTPGSCEETPTVTLFIPKNKISDSAIIIFPGGGYCCRAQHEGIKYAEFLAENGFTAFVCDYRVYPHSFPLPLLDARRAVRWVRANAEKYGINKNKIAVMGSSAGGHLAALVSTYTKPIDFEKQDGIDSEDFLPNATILCYPVVISPDAEGVSHKGSYDNLMGEKAAFANSKYLDPALNVTESTPTAFIWHTSEDNVVNVINSYKYASELRKHNIAHELHVLPHGGHGMGLAAEQPHVAQWSGLLLNWLRYTFD